MRVFASLLLLVLLTPASYTQKSGDDFAAASQLAEGLWHRVKTVEAGVYRISYSKLTQMGFSDPSAVKVYGNNFGQISYYNSDARPDDLREIPVSQETGGGYLLFYAEETHRWRYNYTNNNYYFYRHHYSDTAVYFLTEKPDEPLAPEPVAPPPGEPQYTTSSYDALYIKEEETENIIKSGREWYQPVSALRDIDIVPGFSSLVPGEPIEYTLRVAGRSSSPTMFRVSSGGETLLSVMVPEVNMYNTTGTFARYGESKGTFPSGTAGGYQISFFNNGEPLARGWLDYLWLHARAAISGSGGQSVFSDNRAFAAGGVSEFIAGNASPSHRVWDVTDPYNIEVMQTTVNGSELRFRASGDTLRQFILFNPATAPEPLFESEPLPNQNLHGTLPADMLIITHPWFREQAERVAALHYENSGLVSEVVSVFDIYNEFSGGIPDITAIRNFVRMVWLKHSESENPLRYLLLFGDGSYENKRLPPDNPNFIPTWQSRNSNVVISSFMSDDFYGLLDESEGESEGFLDIGIGRLPASDTMQARALADKIDIYLNGQTAGNWRNIITFAADDEDSNIHMTDSENLASLLSSVNPKANIEKVYLDAFRQETTTSGQSYPEATRAINERIAKGTLVFNYVGHGSEHGLAHERVVKVSDINSWRNLSQLFLLITATCEFSRYDNIEYNIVQGIYTPKTSAGEMALLSPHGGAVALMSTTRVVFSAPNYILNRNIYQYMFERDDKGEPLRLGDMIRLAKVNSGFGNNKRNFSLLGDPALQLAFPSDAVVATDSVNGVPAGADNDTLKALSEITIAGRITGSEGEFLSGFNGMIHATIFDKPVMVTTLANDGGPVMNFPLHNTQLFNGKSMVKDGLFSLTFMVPRDIDYNYGNARISYYASDTVNNTHASGYWDQLIAGGFSESLITDTIGPAIELYLNNTNFREGGLTGSEPVLLAIISDSSGINSTGTGIGRDIIMWLNDDISSSSVLNSFYETDLDNYRRGKIVYPLDKLDPGSHSLTLKAWDNYNNSSQETLLFVVGEETLFRIGEVLNYPNPFREITTFLAGHNRADENIDVEIVIFDSSGRKIRMLRSHTPAGGYAIEPIVWDGTCDDGSKAGSGIYIYRITLRTSDNEIASGSGRIIIL